MKSIVKLSNFEFPHLEMDLKKVLYASNLKGEIEHEIWKDIPDYEGYYQISTFGRVKSRQRTVNRGDSLFKVKERIMSQQKPQTYFCVKFKKDGNYVQFQVHQLMAISFLNHKPCGFKIVIDHIDNNPINNRLENIQLTTNRHNASKDKTSGTSKYIGVGWCEKRKKWRAGIYINGKNQHLGFFTNEKEASKYYQEALKSIERGTEINIKRRTPTSEVKGVGYRKDHNVWVSRVLVDGKRKHLGNFKTEQEAIDALEYYNSNI